MRKVTSFICTYPTHKLVDETNYSLTFSGLMLHNYIIPTHELADES